MRPLPDEYFISIVKEVAKRSTCLRSQDGALIVRGMQIVSTGYNGAPSKITHCSEVGCIREQNQIPSGERHELCRGAHAEANAIVYAARYGISVEGATMYCTRFPCSFCSKMAVNAGIKRVVFIEDYPDELAKDILRNVVVERGIT